MFVDPFAGCNFTNNKHLTQAFIQKTRRLAGGVIESGVMTPISDGNFTNYPEAFMQYWIIRASKS